MTSIFSKIIHYLPRILSVLIILFFGVFILEGFGKGFSWQDSAWHAIIPLVSLAATMVAWRQPKVGGWFFVTLGLFFALFFHPLLWNGLIFGSLPVITGVLFLFNKNVN